MNNTEQFDEWIRGEMDSLDDSPDHFRQADIWQKLQTELHPVPEKELSFIKRVFVTLTVRRAEASKFRIAAAAALLILMGVVWWKIQSTPAQMAVNQSVSKSQNQVVLQGKQPVLAKKNEVLKEKVTFKKHESRRKQSEEKLTEISLAQAPIVVHSEFDKNIGSTNNVGKVLNARQPVLADVPEAPKNIAETTELPAIANVAEKTTNQPIAKTAPKPKFKIVHANELADYQKAELAEVREKEAKTKGFVVINWKANATTHSESSLMSYFKNKSSKAD